MGIPEWCPAIRLAKFHGESVEGCALVDRIRHHVDFTFYDVVSVYENKEQEEAETQQDIPRDLRNL